MSIEEGVEMGVRVKMKVWKGVQEYEKGWGG